MAEDRLEVEKAARIGAESRVKTLETTVREAQAQASLAEDRLEVKKAARIAAVSRLKTTDQNLKDESLDKKKLVRDLDSLRAKVEIFFAGRDALLAEVTQAPVRKSKRLAPGDTADCPQADNQGEARYLQ